MKKALNENEKHVIRVLIFLSSFYGLIILIINLLVADSIFKIIISILCIILSGVFLFVKKEIIFGSILTKVIPATKAKRNITDNHWNITLTYDNNDKEITRIGSIEFSNSMVGVKIYGSKLIDHDTKEIKQGTWFADDAELITLYDKKVLIYLYKIPKTADIGRLDKVGIVVAIQNDGDNVFKGTFKDILVHDNNVQREGEILLFEVN